MTNPSRDELSKYQSFCADLLQEADDVALRFFGTGSEGKNKLDGTIVTAADTAIETALRSRICSQFKTHTILGEEEDSNIGDSEWIWIIDPIDGTQNFANGITTFGTIIGLYYRDTPVVGGISHPALNLRYLAARGLGATKNGARLQIRNSLPAAIRSHELWGISSPDIFAGLGKFDLYSGLCRHHPAIRVYYDCFAHTLAAEGALGAHFEIGMKIWDIAATELLVTEAGGAFRYIEKPPSISRTGKYSAIFGKAEAVSELSDAVASYEAGALSEAKH